MILYLEKRGCDFQPDGKSDLGHFRLFLEFIDKEGRRVCGDVVRGYVWSKGKVVGDCALYAHWQYENYKGAFAYPLPGSCAGQYTKADVLSLVNRYSAVKYDAAEIVEKLPAGRAPVPGKRRGPESGLFGRRSRRLASIPRAENPPELCGLDAG